MEYISTKEASEKWGISTIRITVLANEGRIAGAQRLGRRWLIPATATKPQELKPNHNSSAKKKGNENNNFSFPLYHFRPDWSYLNEDNLTEQQHQLLTAERAVMECRFDDAYKMLEGIMKKPDDTITEIGSLWNGGVCSIALNKPEDFSKILLRLQMIMAEDFAHRDDLMVILDSLKTYTETLSTVANEYTYNADIHEQSLPLSCLLAEYSQLTKEAIKPGSTDVNLLELNLRLIKNTGAIIVAEFMHLYMVGIYYLRNDMQKAERHARTLVQIAYEHKHYFPLVTYHRYFSAVLNSIIEEYPEDFQKLCSELIANYDENFNAFYSTLEKYSVTPKLKDTDFPYIYAVMMNLSNNEIAQRMNISPRTVKRRLDAIFKMLNVGSKKELRDYIKSNI